MGCECASLRMEVLSQKSEILSQRTLMVQWFEALMTELQDVKKQNSELRESFNSSNRRQQESIVVNSEPSILEGFPVNGSLESNGSCAQNVLECHAERSQETYKPLVKSVKVAPKLDQDKLIVETGFQLTEDGRKIFSPEIEPAEVNSEYFPEVNSESPLLQLERFESEAIDAQKTLVALPSEDKSIGTRPKNKRSETVHRSGISSPKRQGLDEAKRNKSSTRKIGKFRCSKCPYVARNPSVLKAHSLTHTGEKPFQCSVCNKSFTQKSKLLRHNFIHTGEKPFQCTICKKSFARKQHFMRHNLIHTGEKPFSCDLCDHRCRDYGDLSKHKMTHTGEKPFECDQCDYRCSQSCDLSKHKMTHTGEKPFQCDQCDYRSSFKFNLTTHRRIHTGEKPFQCDMCDYRATLKCSLVSHKKRIHRQER